MYHDNLIDKFFIKLYSQKMADQLTGKQPVAAGTTQQDTHIHGGAAVLEAHCRQGPAAARTAAVGPRQHTPHLGLSAHLLQQLGVVIRPAHAAIPPTPRMRPASGC